MEQEEEKDKKKKSPLSPEDLERLKLLQDANERKGMQLSIADTGDLKEINEIKQLMGKDFENPEEKYQLYYKGIQSVLIKYLPKGEMYEDGRQIIYDEKNIFLNRGKKKSDGDGIRGSDGRMTYQENMKDMLDLILKWVSESQKPIELYNMLYELNEKHGYGHESYDKTSISYDKAVKKIKEG